MRDVCIIVSNRDARLASVRWIDEIDTAADAYTSANPARLGAPHLHHARRMAQMARQAINQGQADAAAMSALAALQAAWQAELAEAGFMIGIGTKTYRRTQAKNAERHKAAEEKRDE